MRLFPVVFYDDNNPDAGGGGGNDTQNQQKVNTSVDLTKPLFTETEMKEFGFDNQDQLREHLRQFKENSVPDEEKKKKEELDKANFIKYSAEENLLTVDEYTQYETLSKKADRDLVFESWLPAWKEENPDVDEAEAERLAKTDFESEYKLDSQNEKAKARGEARLAKEAKELKSPVESKFNTAKKGYEEIKSMRSTFPEFKKFLGEVVNELTPDTLNIAKIKDGEQEIVIPVNLTKAERDEITKVFENNKTFYDYMKSEGKAKEKLAPVLTKKINSFLRNKYFDTVAEGSYKAGKGIGMKSGSNAGAENPYGLQPEKGHQGGEPTPDVQKQIRENHKQLSQKYK